MSWKFRGKKDNAKKFIIDFMEQIIKKNKGKQINVFDVFGGSCYVSHLIKQTFPEVNVLCNDFDKINETVYTKGYDKKVNQILSYIQDNLSREYSRQETIDECDIKMIKKYLKKNEVDKMPQIVQFNIIGNFCYSMQQSSNTNRIKYYNLPKKYEKEDMSDYLKGVEIYSMDFKEFLQIKRKGVNVYILDPPYHGTGCNGYEGQLNLDDQIQILKFIHENNNIIYFCNEKAETLEIYKAILSWFDENVEDEYNIETYTTQRNKKNIILTKIL